MKERKRERAGFFFIIFFFFFEGGGGEGNKDQDQERVREIQKDRHVIYIDRNIEKIKIVRRETKVEKS